MGIWLRVHYLLKFLYKHLNHLFLFPLSVGKMGFFGSTPFKCYICTWDYFFFDNACIQHRTAYLHNVHFWECIGSLTDCILFVLFLKIISGISSSRSCDGDISCCQPSHGMYASFFLKPFSVFELNCFQNGVTFWSIAVNCMN